MFILRVPGFVGALYSGLCSEANCVICTPGLLHVLRCCASASFSRFHVMICEICFISVGNYTLTNTP